MTKRCIDADKICLYCSKPFNRREFEARGSFLRRECCSTECGKKHQGAMKAGNAKSRRTDGYFTDVSCVTCEWMREDTDHGEHCPRCTTGQMFREKGQG